MGGVCSGGTVKKKTNNKSLEVEQEKASGFSGKLKPMGSFGKKKNDDSYAYPDEMDGFEKGQPNLYDSGELYLSISRELKPSTPARTPANKVSINCIQRCVCVHFPFTFSEFFMMRC